jgi:peptide/nickel transport system permease protein
LAVVERLGYVLRRLGYAGAVLAGVHVLTFALFFTLHTPDDMARLNLGSKRLTEVQVAHWKAARGYDRPLWHHPQRTGVAQFTETVFWLRTASLLQGDFGPPDAQGTGDIGHELRQRLGVSLSLAGPLVVLLLGTSTLLAAGLAWARRTRAEVWGLALCGVLLAVSTLFVLVFGQALVAGVWRLAPASGFVPGGEGVRFLVLPVVLAVLARLGGEVRFQRAALLEALDSAAVQAARARGVSAARVMGQYVLRQALVPIFTSLGHSVPTVVLGSVVVEQFFGLPGLGAYVVDAIAAQDFAVVRSLVWVGAVLVVGTNALVDLACAWADPRVERVP